MRIRGTKLGLFKGGIFVSIFLCLIFTPRPISAESTQETIEKIQQISEQRDSLQVEVDTFAAQIKFLEDQITASQQLIDKNTKAIEENKIMLEREQNHLSEYLRVIYEENQTSFFENIVKAQTFSDFVDRGEYLKSVKDKIQDSVLEINKIKSELSLNQRKLGEAMVQNQLAKASLDKQKAEKDKQLSDLTEQEKQIREKFAERLQKLGIGGVSYCKKDGKLIKAKYSVLSFPTDCGYISQGFGMTEFASIDRAYNGAIHNGFDVAINTGTPLKATGNGVVYAKGVSPSGGWGNWVMIKHDKIKINNSDIEFYSLYGHMVVETHLKVGDRVDPNSIVGFSGGTPYWAPHLHYSLFVSNSGWQDGRTGPYPGNVVDPLDYMDIPISTIGTDWDPKYTH